MRIIDILNLGLQRKYFIIGFALIFITGSLSAETARNLPMLTVRNLDTFQQERVLEWEMEKIDVAAPVLLSINVRSPYTELNSANYAYYKQALFYAEKYNLPIAIQAPDLAYWLTLDPYYSYPAVNNPNTVQRDNSVSPILSPLGPTSLWEEIGRKWASSPAMDMLQQWYQFPGEVIIMTQMSSPMLEYAAAESSVRFTDHYGYGYSNEFKRSLFTDLYTEKYFALASGVNNGLDHWGNVGQTIILPKMESSVYSFSQDMISLGDKTVLVVNVQQPVSEIVGKLWAEQPDILVINSDDGLGLDKSEHTLNMVLKALEEIHNHSILRKFWEYGSKVSSYPVSDYIVSADISDSPMTEQSSEEDNPQIFSVGEEYLIYGYNSDENSNPVEFTLPKSGSLALQMDENGNYFYIDSAGELHSNYPFDGNHDGIADSAQSNVRTLIPDTNGTVTFSFPEDIGLQEIRKSSVADANYLSKSSTPEKIHLLNGAYQFKVSLENSSENIQVKIHQDEFTYASQHVYRISGNESQWYDFSFDGRTGARIEENSIVLHLQDGGRGDYDNVKNGEILFQGGVARVQNSTAQGNDSDTGQTYCYPNPFRPDVDGNNFIRYALDENSRVTLKIYDTGGRLVRTLLSEASQVGGISHQVSWDGKNGQGYPVASGTYFYRIETSSSHRMVGKIAVIR